MNFRISEYAAVEAEIGHRFRNDMSMSDIITAAAASSPVNPEGAEHATVLEFGQGQLSWPRFERQTDRYGTVFLCTGPDGEDSFESARRLPRPARRRRAGNPTVRPLW